MTHHDVYVIVLVISEAISPVFKLKLAASDRSLFYTSFMFKVTASVCVYN